MEIYIEQQNDALHFEAKNEDGHTVAMDGKAEHGGNGLGMRPMQVLLSALGTCSAFDAVSILKKQQQPLENLKVKVTGARDQSKAPSPFTAIHLHFTAKGALDEQKVKRAISLAVDKYCSVKETLNPAIPVTYDFEVVG